MEIIARGQITIWNYKDGDDAYSVILNHDTHAVACDSSGNALVGELGPSGKAVFALSAYKGATKLTMRYAGAASAAGICAWKFGTISGCSAAQISGSNEKFYISTMTADSAYVEVVCSVDGKASVTRRVTIVRQKKGDAGAPGRQGRAIRPRGIWTARTLYMYNEEYRDVVIYNNSVYIVKATHTSAVSFDSSQWEPFNEFINVATSVLLANKGYIDVLGAARLFVGDTNKSTGWEMTNGYIRHTGSGLTLTSDGRLHDPDGLHLSVGGKTVQDIVAGAVDTAARDADRKYAAAATVTSLQTSVSQLEGRIALKAEKTEITGVREDVGRLSTRISRTELQLEPESIWLGLSGRVLRLKNLVRNGRLNIIDSTSYLVGTVSLIKELSVGSRYTIVMKIPKIGEGREMLLYDYRGSICQKEVQKTSLNESGCVKFTFDYRPSPSNTVHDRLKLYNYPSADTSDNPMSVDWICLYEGDTDAPLEFIQCPDDYATEEEVRTGISVGNNMIRVLGRDISLNGSITFTSLAPDAQGRINTAQNAASAAQRTADRAITEKIELSRLGSTVIEGGYIKTDLIRTSELFTRNITATSFNLAGGMIGGFKVSQTHIGDANDRLSLTPDGILFRSVTKRVGIGNVIPASSGNSHLVGGMISVTLGRYDMHGNSGAFMVTTTGGSANTLGASRQCGISVITDNGKHDVALRFKGRVVTSDGRQGYNGIFGWMTPWDYKELQIVDGVVVNVLTKPKP